VIYLDWDTKWKFLSNWFAVSNEVTIPFSAGRIVIFLTCDLPSSRRPLGNGVHRGVTVGSVSAIAYSKLNLPVSSFCPPVSAITRFE
jgi:hypothetical protein